MSHRVNHEHQRYCAQKVVLKSTSSFLKSIFMTNKVKNSIKFELKRKIELEALPNKVNVVSKPKALLKAELVVKLKDLQKRFDIFKNEHSKNVESLTEEKGAHEETKSKNQLIIQHLQEIWNSWKQ